ncbi:basic proline-rich protein-like [Sphaeramia orbicularis]|uniref:basic proline-rich protein-like n=1 Tax=Sphaeramia orbicularis TaxID=375764 RepID=UPI00118126AC|nr:basic proline-rich protein-like [Sphaeramia orbicularis]
MQLNKARQRNTGRQKDLEKQRDMGRQRNMGKQRNTEDGGTQEDRQGPPKSGAAQRPQAPNDRSQKATTPPEATHTLNHPMQSREHGPGTCHPKAPQTGAGTHHTPHLPSLTCTRDAAITGTVPPHSTRPSDQHPRPRSQSPPQPHPIIAPRENPHGKSRPAQTSWRMPGPPPTPGGAAPGPQGPGTAPHPPQPPDPGDAGHRPRPNPEPPTPPPQGNPGVGSTPAPTGTNTKPPPEQGSPDPHPEGPLVTRSPSAPPASLLTLRVL